MIKKNKFMSSQKNEKVCSLAGITQDRAERYKRRQNRGNNLDVPPEDRSYWALRKPWRHLIRHLSSSLQPISWARLESILRLSPRPRRQTHTPSNMMDEGSAHTQAVLFQQSMTPFTPTTLPVSTVCLAGWLADHSFVLIPDTFMNKRRQM